VLRSADSRERASIAVSGLPHLFLADGPSVRRQSYNLRTSAAASRVGIPGVALALTAMQRHAVCATLLCSRLSLVWFLRGFDFNFRMNSPTNATMIFLFYVESIKSAEVRTPD
jgi:hypothetical protein